MNLPLGSTTERSKQTSTFLTFFAKTQEIPMSINRASPSEVIHLQALGSKIGSTKTSTLFKTEVMEAIRLVLPAGKHVAEHKAPGEITVLCLEGRVTFTSQGVPKELSAGDLLYLTAADPHAVEAMEDSSLLVTILLKNSRSRTGD
jgi:quercetin dioxygenase-like cupin family protein